MAKVDWIDIGIKRDGTYFQSEYRGMHVELYNRVDGKWDWSFYDDKSPEPDLAVVRDTEATRESAEAELFGTIDGYLS